MKSSSLRGVLYKKYLLRTEDWKMQRHGC